MATLTERLLERLTPAFDALEPGADPVLRSSDRADFQVNGVMGLAKRLGRPPREVAEELVGMLDLSGLADAPEIAGPGFLNLTVTNDALISQLDAMGAHEALGIPAAAAPEVIVVDYSAPNVAK